MQFDIITIFPDFFAGPLDYGIVRRAREAGLVDVRIHDLRAFTHDRHRTVDDRPFGGGEGMVLKPEPLFEAVESLMNGAVQRGEFGQKDTSGVMGMAPEETALQQAPNESSSGQTRSGGANRTAIVLLSASGKLFRQDTARRFAQLDRVILICGRYEGVDERVAEHLATDELSIGDFVLSGGELGAALIVDAVTRLLPGALGNEDSSINESFGAVAPDTVCTNGRVGINAGITTTQDSPFANAHGRPVTDYLLLEGPHYTRPADFRGWPVPEVLLGGNHEEIRRWRQEKAREKTRRNRPDLLG